MAIMFRPAGVVLQDVEQIMPNQPTHYNYNGLCAFSSNPLTKFPKSPIASALSAEFNDWIIYERHDGSYSFKPEAFYSPVFLERYLNFCIKQKLLIKCIFIDYDGDETLWKFSLPKGKVLGYEVCNTPKNSLITQALDSPEYKSYRFKLNQNGLFCTAETAYDFKNRFMEDFNEKYKFYRSDQITRPSLNIFRLYEIEEFQFKTPERKEFYG